ncbi:hypothetical protein [Parasphaerochaeta coccoides]|uniref:Uncharacterized protein n=1 Tax=Parasphaerochaeta coccoides (strain ATCC BAA-1237 / DSM 17374 / SPN1) TaxID=760011 RepID=F4GIM7_PARC1|nr:hypothetical protein [Parasphaerochaeta coccoides]AEC02161.1 hypothetical protein Spico_0937 [Parasphaerochaeta coccoides DSM 17374]
MIQAYYLSVTWLFGLAGLLLVGPYGGTLSVLLNLRSLFVNSRPVRVILAFLGFILGFLLLCFPIAPGPRILGDFIPAVVTLAGSVWLTKCAGTISAWQREEKTGGTPDHVRDGGLSRPEDIFIDPPGESKKIIWGHIVFIVAAIHFLFPMAVLL